MRRLRRATRPAQFHLAAKDFHGCHHNRPCVNAVLDKYAKLCDDAGWNLTFLWLEVLE